MSAPTASRTRIAPADFLRIADLSPEELKHILALASAMKEGPGPWRDAFSGESLACYFAKPSTRTRVSFEAAAHRLGLLPVMLRPEELQLGRGEPITDTARVLSSYCAAIVVRTFAQHELECMAGAASVPVINALTDLHHPCQVLADVMTLREHFGAVAGLKLAYLGDGNNVAHSLMEVGALLGMEIAVAAPAGFEPDPEITVEAEITARTHGGSIDVADDPERVVAGADVVYTDVWVSMGDVDAARRKHAALEPYRVTTKLMSLAAKDAVFMHCLPAHRGEEVEEDVIDGPQSIVFAQAANRMPTEQAVLYDLIKAPRGAVCS
jgi:ornithine carbamoyltransferase